MLTKVARLPLGSVRYLEAGAGHPLVLLHAFPLSADQWLPQVLRARPGWRYVAPDLRGFRGESPAFEDLAPDGLTMDDYAADVIELMNHLDVSRAVIAGLSMGGYVALALVRRWPERVAGLVLANTRAAGDTDEGRAKRDRLIEIARTGGAPAVAAHALPGLLGETTKREQPDLLEALERTVLRNSTEAIVAAAVAMKARPDSTPLLPSIAVPTLVVHGAEDAIIPLAEAEAMPDAIPGARLEVLPRAGHLSNLEAPLAFNVVLERVAGDWNPATSA